MRKNQFFKKTGTILLALILMVTAVPQMAWAKEKTAPETIYGKEETVLLDQAVEKGREIRFNEDWKFYLGNPSGAQNTGFNDSSWEGVTLPHDFSISQQFTTEGEAESGFLLGGTGWYRKHFVLSEQNRNDTVYLNFDGVYSDAFVYVNGRKAGEHHYGYTSFGFDISKDLVFDGKTENVIAVKVVNHTPSSRWYSGSGIYRDVTLDIVSPVHILPDGITVTTPDIEKKQGTVTVRAEIGSDDQTPVTVKAGVYDENGHSVSEEAVSEVKFNGKKAEAELTLSVASPVLWSVDHPSLYTVKTEVVKDGVVTDTKDTSFGFRFVKFDPASGFSLNGKNMKLNGMCMHHDQGALGSAAYDNAMRRQVLKLKDMGVNAIRTSHNPADKDLIRICNEEGMLLIEEAYDTWKMPKNSNVNDFSGYFTKTIGAENEILGGTPSMTWGEFDIKAMVERDKNAPSVILWSLGNEIQEGNDNGYDTSDYPQVAQQLIDWVKEADATRQITFGDNQIKNDNRIALQVADVIHRNGGVVGLNYASDGQNDKVRKNHPDWSLYASETSSAINSRSIYSIRGNNNQNHQRTAYDESAVLWGMTAHESIYNTMKNDAIAGEFVWTGFDYIGEPTPWNGTGRGTVAGGKGAAPNSSYFGVIDTAGFEKDTYYLYRSQWNKKDTTLHLVTAWDSKNQVKDRNGKTPVMIYSNAPVVKLYRDDTLIGTATRKVNTTPAGHSYDTYTVKSNDSSICSAVTGNASESLYASFNVAYKDGTIRAEAYDEAGKRITSTHGTSSVSTPEAAAELKVKADRTEMKADESDLAYIEVDVTDGTNLLTTADQKITFELQGEGTIEGVDNGNAASVDKLQQPSVLKNEKLAEIRAFGGKALAIVKGTDKAGTITVKVSSEGLKGKTVTVKTKAAEEEAGEGLTACRLIRDYSVLEGTKPVLKTEAVGVKADGTEVKGTVAWEDIPATAYEKPGDYTVKGVLSAAGETISVTGRIHVIADAKVMLNYSAVTETGKAPKLPSQVQGVYADGTEAGVYKVNWQEMPVTAYGKAGTIVSVRGTASVFGEKTLPVTASIRVADAVVTESQNVAGQCLSLTESCTNRSDNLNSIINKKTNDKISLDERWTNYNNKGISDEASITFSWATAPVLGSANLYFFTDTHSAAVPAAVKFEASLDGTKFVPVEYTQSPETAVDCSKGATVYTFKEPVNPVKLRITLTQKPGHCVGLTEVELMTFASSIKANHMAELTDLKVNGTSIPDFGSEKTAYKVQVEDILSAAVTPSFTEEENPAVTVLPVYQDVVRVITISEDGAAGKMYEVSLEKKVEEKPDPEKPDPEKPEPDVPVKKEKPSVTFSAAKAPEGKIALTGTFKDYKNADRYYEVTNHGLIYYSSKKLGTKLLTVNTPGRTRVSFKSYKADGSFTYNMKPQYEKTEYTVRAFLEYTDADGNTCYAYSYPERVSYRSVR